jgi:hypothetical protein
VDNLGMAIKTGNLPWFEAILKVLQGPNKAMHYTEIAQAIVDQKLRKDVGATPAATVNAYISWSIKKEPEKTPFERVNRGIYKLLEVSGKVTQTAAPLEAPPEIEQAKVEKSAGIIQAFGMFWRHDRVEWSNNPKLLGKQKAASKQVDLCDQRGVYLLHDLHRVIYVGKAVDQPLGRRLHQHNSDRFNGRWDRFSWFGIRQVSPEGHIKEPDLSNLSIALIVKAFEALLIEGLEPPQNRRGGDDFEDVEYLQVEDSAIIKRREDAAIIARLVGKRDGV